MSAIPEGYTVLRDGTVIGKFGRPLTPHVGEDGRVKIVLQVNGRMKHAGVSRMVCAEFNGPPPFPDAVVRHLDNDQLNNHAENLVWATRSEINRLTVELNGPGGGNPKLTLSEADVIRQLAMTGKFTHAQIGKMYEVSAATVARIRANKTYVRPTN